MVWTGGWSQGWLNPSEHHAASPNGTNREYSQLDDDIIYGLLAEPLTYTL